jgi:hypothetical protein
MDHTLRFTLDTEFGDLYAEAYLNPWHPWYKRIWLAIKYVLSIGHGVGHFDCWMMNYTDCDKLIALLQRASDIGKSEVELGKLHDALNDFNTQATTV